MLPASDRLLLARHSAGAFQSGLLAGGRSLGRRRLPRVERGNAPRIGWDPPWSASVSRPSDHHHERGVKNRLRSGPPAKRWLVDHLLPCILEKHPLRQSRSAQDCLPRLHGTSATAGGSASHQQHRYRQNARCAQALTTHLAIEKPRINDKLDLDGSAINGSHDHVDGAQNRHDVGNFVSLEDVRKDLKVVAVSGPDLEAPGGYIVVALDEHSDFAFA